ncbi:MAG: cyclic nucleotide-binding domain-containing protein [Xanthomonadales bacterium]|nr:cyclic nucleotide-binding domain-containing protein [Xanthomonadales bacterium]
MNMKFLKKLETWSDIADYPAQTVIFSEGDPAETLYAIISGEVELTLGGDLLSTETSGGVIGEMTLIGNTKHGATASALTGVRAAKLNREQLNEFMLESTEFSLHILNALASRLRIVDEYITTDFKQKK